MSFSNACDSFLLVRDVCIFSSILLSGDESDRFNDTLSNEQDDLGVDGTGDVNVSESVELANDAAGC